MDISIDVKTDAPHHTASGLKLLAKPEVKIAGYCQVIFLLVYTPRLN